MIGNTAGKDRLKLDTGAWEQIMRAAEKEHNGVPVEFGSASGVWSDDPFLVSVTRVGNDLKIQVEDGGSVWLDRVTDYEGLIQKLRVMRSAGRLTVKAHLRPIDVLGFDHSFAHILDANWDSINEGLQDRYGASLRRSESWMKTTLVVEPVPARVKDDGLVSSVTVSDIMDNAWDRSPSRALLASVRSGRIAQEIWEFARRG
ncbi:hypothetical protein ACFVAJ_16640 [Agromyces sp. NPDC057679]|uniref:hypothetical protein n=1 Tax=Agromyces sp. NPDC057679 TaxID=3346207 RepID=UPI003670C828